MSGPFAPRVGGVSSADIAVPEHERELRFYARVLTTGERPLWRADLMNNQGMPIIGLGARSPEYEQLPLQWMPHIQVDDVAASARRAIELGGSEIMHGRDDEGQSQWAVLLDPDGAAFGLIPLVPADAVPPAEGSAVRVGRIAWLVLSVLDASASREFYTQVVGWSVKEDHVGGASGHGADDQLLGGDGYPVAGICHARGVNEALPSVWLLHLPVGDLVESLRRVREEGGEVIRETQGEDGGCASAVIQDPVGVCLALVPG